MSSVLVIEFAACTRQTRSHKPTKWYSGACLPYRMHPTRIKNGMYCKLYTLPVPCVLSMMGPGWAWYKARKQNGILNHTMHSCLYLLLTAIFQVNVPCCALQLCVHAPQTWYAAMLPKAKCCEPGWSYMLKRSQCTAWHSGPRTMQPGHLLRSN